MPIHFRHPSTDRLAELGAESGPDRERITRHARDCERCQRELRFIRRIERAGPDVLNPELPSEILDRVLKSRAASVRVIAPSAIVEGPRARSLTRPVLVAAALLAVVALAIFSTRTNTVAAESESTLVITPAKPERGARVAVEYHPAILAFSHANRLTLRGRLRTARDNPYGGGTTESLSALSKDAEGVFRGAFVLPDSVVYVALAVEDSTAATVDSRDGRLWEVVVHDSNGTPGVEALGQRENDFMGRSWEEAYATARLNVRVHPKSLAAWSEVQFFERELLGDRAADSLAKTRSKMLVEITNRYRTSSDVSANELGTLVWWSYVDKDTAALAYWYARLANKDPHHPQVAQIAAAKLWHRYWDTAPRTLLDSLESLWSRVAPVYGPGTYIITSGQQVARKLGDGKSYQRWVDRSQGRDSLGRTGIALVTFAPTRDEGMRRIRAALNSPPDPDANRPLIEERVADTVVLHVAGGVLLAGQPREPHLERV